MNHMVTDLETRLVQALLDRLDPRMDEPCTVPGCIHLNAEESHDAICCAAA